LDHRIEKELEILRSFYPKVTCVENGQWVLIEDYPIPPGLLWNREKTSVCFQIPVAYPGAPPYGFYVPSGILYEGRRPGNYQEPSNNKPPVPPDIWGLFSWTQESEWKASDDPHRGSNLLDFVTTFKDRFLEGA
jgi:hypothetical protein